MRDRREECSFVVLVMQVAGCSSSRCSWRNVEDGKGTSTLAIAWHCRAPLRKVTGIKYHISKKRKIESRLHLNFHQFHIQNAIDSLKSRRQISSKSIILYIMSRPLLSYLFRWLLNPQFHSRNTNNFRLSKEWHRRSHPSMPPLRLPLLRLGRFIKGNALVPSTHSHQIRNPEPSD